MKKCANCTFISLYEFYFEKYHYLWLQEFKTLIFVNCFAEIITGMTALK